MSRVIEFDKLNREKCSTRYDPRIEHNDTSAHMSVGPACIERDSKYWSRAVNSDDLYRPIV